jgi:hypothetical protein
MTTATEDYLAEAAEPVREQLSTAVPVGDFLSAAGTLTQAERRLLVEQALVLMEQNYVHLPLKAAMHAVNPVQRLRLLRARLERQTPETMPPEWTFHAELSAIFHSVRDLHTNYLLPLPYAGKIAFLPFEIEEYLEDGRPRYLVTRVMSGFSAPGFGRGADVTHWNGIPMARAVDIQADRFAGSNPAARHSRGVQSMTIRSLRLHLPPDEEWVTVSYRGLDGAEHELRQAWVVADNLPSSVDADTVSPAAVAMGLDLEGDETARAKKMLFLPEVVALEQAADEIDTTTTSAEAGEEVATTMPGVFRARSVATPSGTFGHLRIFTFSVNDPNGFVAELVRLMQLLPQDGLIVDVRGNGGGHIHASEFALQTLTARRISPEPVQFTATPLNTRICRRHRDNPTNQIDLGPWYRSMDESTETGATFSGAFSITPEHGANAIGQQYFGPVVLVTDARCYSATDIFAAGFQDHAIGPVLGVDDNTGAGGANVWTQALLKQLLEIPSPVDTTSPYRTLPHGANMRVSIRRTVRVGRLAGTPVEDLGVVPNHRHKMTRRDLLEDNVDLLAHAGRLLAEQPLRRLDVVGVDIRDGSLVLELDGTGIDWVAVYVDGRPRASADLQTGTTTVSVAGVSAATTVRADGYAGGELAACRTVRVGQP